MVVLIVVVYVERTLEREIKKLWKLFPSVFVVGPRRAGKTTLVKKIADELGLNYVSLDDPEARKVFNKNIKEFSREFLAEENVIDEIQYGEDPGRKLKYLIDLEGKRFIVTGSSARAVSENVLSFLVGRASWVVLWPFSLEEIGRCRTERKRPTTPEWERFSKEYVKTGGFPEVVLSKTPEETVEALARLLISKEVPLLENVDATELWTVAEGLALSQGGPANISALSRATGLTTYAIRKILNALEEAFIVRRIRPFFRRRRVKELRKAPKIYFTDPGVLNAIRGTYIVDGVAFETAVLAEILKGIEEPPQQLYYWRTKEGAEVDFVVKRGQRIVAVEAKMSWPEGKVPRGLRSFIEAYEPEKALIVDLRAEEWEERVGRTTVKKIPLWRLREEIA